MAIVASALSPRWRRHSLMNIAAMFASNWSINPRSILTSEQQAA